MSCRRCARLRSVIPAAAAAAATVKTTTMMLGVRLPSPCASSPLDAESVSVSPLPSGVVGADVGDVGLGLRIGVAVLGAGVEGGLGDGSEVALVGFGEGVGRGVGAEVGFDAIGCPVRLPPAVLGALVAGDAVPQSKAPTKMPATAPFGPVMSPVPTGLL